MEQHPSVWHSFLNSLETTLEALEKISSARLITTKLLLVVPASIILITGVMN